MEEFRTSALDRDGRGIADGPVSPGGTDPWERLATLLPVAHLTQQVHASRLADGFSTLVIPEGWEAARHSVFRALYRRPPAPVLVTGSKGVGKTTFVSSLARWAAEPDSFLLNQPFVLVDCQNVGPEDSRACLEMLFSAVGNDPQVVLCADGFGSLLRRTQGTTNKALLLNMLRRPETRFMGIVSHRDYVDLIGQDAQMLERFVRIELTEPSDPEAIEIATRWTSKLCSQFGVTAEPRLAERTVTCTSTFMLSDAQPAKSIRILEQVFSDREYDRAHGRDDRRHVTTADVAQAVAEKTGIPVPTIRGDTDATDFDAVLRDAVVGQDAAVRQVASELRLIKAGLAEAGKPAAVLLFAGMTGVGKTELAKRVAELYSASRRLQVYTMGNFTEPHSVSGIIGVPAGYVGHELGGRLVNELNADPYSVFLLDEAEKCHPNVWKPFLNLFDEGWIVDQRGVKAYADRAIFILTTNAGDRNIAQMAKTGQPPEEIADRVKLAMSKVRQERSSQPVFPPQFLSRIKRIVVFSPLGQDALRGIVGLQWRRLAETWNRKCGKQLVASDELLTALAERAHLFNERSGGQEGGRVVRRLLADCIESRIQDAALTRPDEYRNGSVIRMFLQTPAIQPDKSAPDDRGFSIDVTFEP